MLETISAPNSGITWKYFNCEIGEYFVTNMCAISAPGHRHVYCVDFDKRREHLCTYCVGAKP